MKRMWIAVVVVALAALLFALAGGLRSQVVVGRNVPAGERVSFDAIDHAMWNELLARNVDSQGGVNYQAWWKSPADRAKLEEYLNELSRAEPAKTSSPEARLAYWINAYNALTIYGILREYPTPSIRKHTPRWFGYNIWRDLLLTVGGTNYSLDAIEHQVLRKLNEPRIHFAIVCASGGCPVLRNEAFLPGTLNAQLDENAQSFFAAPGRFQYDPKTKQFKLSPILDWFGEDFGKNQTEQLKKIAPHLPSDEARDAAQQSDANVEFLEYDWRLNERKP